MFRSGLFFFLFLSFGLPSALQAAPLDPMDVLKGAVREFFKIRTLEARIERLKVSGLGRKKNSTVAIRYLHPDAFYLQSIEPKGYVQSVSGDAIVAWNESTKKGFRGNVGDVPADEREQLLLVPGFGLSPLLMVNPDAYRMSVVKATPTLVTVKLAPKSRQSPPMEIEFLTEPYRIKTMKIERDDTRVEVTFGGWRKFGDVWMFGEMQSVQWAKRLQTQETSRFYDVKVNEALPAGWLPTQLPENFKEVGREFFTAGVQ